MALKRARMTDVAKKAGVSQTTVSFVLNGIEAGLPESTKQRVLEAARELNYSPNAAARRLASRRSHAIGFAMYDIEYIVDYMTGAAAILAATYAASEIQGHQVVVYTTHERRESGEDAETYFTVPIRSREVDGVIVWDSYVAGDRLAAAFRDGLPIVTVDRVVEEVPSVVPNYEAGLEQVLDLLLSRGHKRFALLYAGVFHRDRVIREAFDQVVARKGIPPSAITVKEGRYYPGNAHRNVQGRLDEILSQPERPTALICGESKSAFEALAYLKIRGIRVPDEMAVVSCTQVPASDYPLIDLTCLNTHWDVMGRHAVELVLRMVRGENLAGTQVVVEPELVVRGSV